VVPVVVSEYQPEIAHVFKNIAATKKAPLYFANSTLQCINHKHEDFRLIFDIENQKGVRFKRLITDLPGTYQLKNIPGVIKTLDLLPAEDFAISENALRKGL